MNLRKPPALRSGDRIAVVAPSSPFDRSAFDRGVVELERLGFEPVVDDRVFARDGYVAGPPRVRAQHLTDVWTRSDVHGVMCARGGYGSVQLLPYLDASLFAQHPKVFVGYSDLTTLLMFVGQQCGIAAFHGPTLVGRLSEGEAAYARDSLRAAVTSVTPVGDVGAFDGRTLVPGEAAGPLWGGTLTQLLASLGTPWAFHLPAGGILFIDEVNERPYRLDRMLMQLRLSGVLRRASAVVFGDLPGCDEPDGAPTARETVARALADFEGPVVWGLPSGHTARPAMTLPLGVWTRVVADDVPRVIIEESAVS